MKEPIIFVYDTNVIISSQNFDDSHTVPIFALSHVSTRFAANNLVLNLDKVRTIKFTKSNSPQWALNTGYK